MEMILEVTAIAADADIQKAWVHEAALRDAEITNGTVQLIPGAEVLAELYAELS